uniref:Sodium/glucose cotransporter 1 n=1 Tax=Poecilia formosa TaxID=48698 RepID=A0A087X310_POEFO
MAWEYFGFSRTFKTQRIQSPTTRVNNAADISVIIIYFLIVLAVGVISTIKTIIMIIGSFILMGFAMICFIVTSLRNGRVSISVTISSCHTSAFNAVGGYVSKNTISTFDCVDALLPLKISNGFYCIPETIKHSGYSSCFLYLLSQHTFLLLETIFADMFSGAIFIQQALGLNIYVAVIALLAITALYTVTGGLAAVIYTDTLQTIIMIIGSFILMGFAFNKVGGYANFEKLYMAAIPTNTTNIRAECYEPRKDSFHLFRDPITGDLPWPGMVFGLTIQATWYWCTDQMRESTCVCLCWLAFIEIILVIVNDVYVLLLYCHLLIYGSVQMINLKSSICLKLKSSICLCFICSLKVAYTEIVIHLQFVCLSSGLRGLMLSVMLASLMSSLTSIFNSASTLFTMDIYTKVRRHAKERELMIAGRVFIVVLIGISIAWIPVVQSAQSGQLFDYIQSITSYLTPPVAAVFMLGMFCKRVNETGAFFGLIIGLLVGLSRMITEFIYGTGSCVSPSNCPTIICGVHYLYFSIILFTVSCIFILGISLMTKPIDDKHVRDSFVIRVV